MKSRIWIMLGGVTAMAGLLTAVLLVREIWLTMALLAFNIAWCLAVYFKLGGKEGSGRTLLKVAIWGSALTLAGMVMFRIGEWLQP